ncbi:MAG: sel1 repeat family protein, partial [Flavobacteriales bacterium]|nr:sel1 repeat family protein [Flavobacteriales bacterium]
MQAVAAIAMHIIGYLYRDGEMGFPRDFDKAMELWLRAGELGYAASYGSIGNAYKFGEGVERDTK